MLDDLFGYEGEEPGAGLTLLGLVNAALCVACFAVALFGG